MFQGIFESFSIPEVRKRILFTLGAFAIFRLGVWIPVPGADPEGIEELLQQALGQGLFGFANLFTGNALSRFSIFALGVIPYINASIIMSLLQNVIPYLKELQKKGDEGRKQIQKYTRYGTVGLAVLQSGVFSFYIANQTQLLLPGINPVAFYFMSILTMTTGTMFLMWLGERITENGIGRGVSMIIFGGILATYPQLIGQAVVSLGPGGGAHPLWGVALVVMFVVVVAGVVLVQLGARRVNIQYAKRVVRGRVYGGQSTFIPFSVNQGGVIPVIFAGALLAIPTTLLNAPGVQGAISAGPDWLNVLSFSLTNQGVVYMIFYGALVMFFTFFYSAIVFDPADVSDNLRRWGGYIPGIRPGQPTSRYLERIQNRILTIGGLFLTVVALIPYIFSNLSGLQTFFGIGGTSILIAVGVGVDTIKQIESHLVERHYESLIRRGGGAMMGRRA
ncbi:MAG: preprotein translocase subunit SecY [Candidatus Bipolaricaulia bacterium]